MEENTDHCYDTLGTLEVEAEGLKFEASLCYVRTYVHSKTLCQSKEYKNAEMESLLPLGGKYKMEK